MSIIVINEKCSLCRHSEIDGPNLFYCKKLGQTTKTPMTVNCFEGKDMRLDEFREVYR